MAIYSLQKRFEELPQPVAQLPFPSENRILKPFEELERASGQPATPAHRIANLIGPDFFKWATRAHSDWSTTKLNEEYSLRIGGLLADLRKVSRTIQGVLITADGFNFYPTPNCELEISFYNERGDLFSVRPSSLTINLQAIAKRRLEDVDNNWHLRQHFGTIYLLSGSSARTASAKQQLQSVGLREGDYTIFPGVDSATVPREQYTRMDNWGEKEAELALAGTQDRVHKGQTACFLAHFRIFKDAKHNYDRANEDYRRALRDTPEDLARFEEEVRRRATILIFEDNVGFGRVNGSTIERDGVGYRFTQSVTDLPADWDFFYLMVMAAPWGGTTQVTEHVRKFTYGVVTKAYAVKHTAFDALCRELGQIETATGKLNPVDHHVANLISKTPFNAYVASPPCCYRTPSLSLVGGGELVDTPWQPDI